MWTAEVLTATRPTGAFVVTVRYRSDASPSVVDIPYAPPTLTPPTDWLETPVRQALDRFTALDALEAAVVVGPLVPKPAPDPTPDPAADDKAAYFHALFRLTEAKRVVALAAAAGAKIDLTALEADVAAKFKAEYVG